mgnify:FL=1
MSKILFIVLTLLIFSCEKLEEQTEFLEYDNYMENGWIAFQASDWDIAMDLFNIGLSQASSNYSEAYSGLGWTYLYQANRLYGESNRSVRDTLRAKAEISFLNAEEEDKYDWDIWSDILAGNTYINSYKADYAWYMFYNDDDFQFDPSLESDMIDYSEKTIKKSNDLFDFDSEYDFQFDPCVNMDNIRYLRAKTFLRLNSYIGLSDICIEEDICIELMLNELNAITTYSCSELETLSDIQEGIDCLNNLSSLLNSCH